MQGHVTRSLTDFSTCRRTAGGCAARWSRGKAAERELHVGGWRRAVVSRPRTTKEREATYIYVPRGYIYIYTRQWRTADGSPGAHFIVELRGPEEICGLRGLDELKILDCILPSGGVESDSQIEALIVWTVASLWWMVRGRRSATPTL
jgi:hypothetical protein